MISLTCSWRYNKDAIMTGVEEETIILFDKKWELISGGGSKISKNFNY